MAEELNTRFNSLQDVKESNHTKDEKEPLKPRNRKIHKNERKDEVKSYKFNNFRVNLWPLKHRASQESVKSA